MARRIEDGVRRGDPATLTIDGRAVAAFAGESVAAALLAAGIRVLRRSSRAGAPRGLFCMMGACQECLVRVNGRRALACQEPVRDGMKIETGTAQ